MTKRLAKDLEEGDRVDFEPTAPFLDPQNQQCAPFEYASIECVGGGWADHMARDGEVVLYTHNFVNPIILPADTLCHVEPWH